MNEWSDGLIVCAGEGCDAAREVVAREASTIAVAATRWLPALADREETVQQTAIKAVDRLADLRTPAAFRGWVSRIAANEAIGINRKNNRREIPLESFDHVVVPGNETWTSKYAKLEFCLWAIAQLPEIQSEVFVLREEVGLSYEEIAELVGIKEGTVGSRLNAARAAIDKLVREAEDV